MKNAILILSINCLLFSFACTSGDSNTANNTVPATSTSEPKDDQIESSSTATTTSAAEETPASEPQSMEVLSWVENLNIRATPNTKGEIVAKAKENESLTLTGNKTEQAETIELRGKSYTEPWVEVKTADGTTGWVFAGAIKKPGEDKGNALNTASNFTFPHFGSFDLSEWKKIDSNSSAGGDAESNSTTYKKGNRLLEFSATDVGEYGWTKSYKLMDANKKVLKERTIAYEPQLNAAGDKYIYKLIETVKDYTTNPGQQYTRSETLKKSMRFVESAPNMAKGDWASSTLAANKMSNATSPKSGSAKKILDEVDWSLCSKYTESEFDCSCDFKEGDPYKGTTLFLFDWDKSACISVNGETNRLYPDWEERDYKADLKKLADQKDWITITNSGVTYFGKPLADHKYERSLDLLVDVLLASGKNLKAIPIKNTADGMAVREIKEVGLEAISRANAYRSKGGKDPLTITKMDNRSHDVIVRYRQTTQYEGEANQYEGFITLLKSRSTEILETRDIKGTCGC